MSSMRVLSYAVLLLTASPLVAGEKVAPVRTDKNGVALDGYDPVAYFVDGKATQGSADISHRAEGATWWFASEGHREKFAAAPEKYIPKYGGYCAYAVSQGGTAPIDPKAWTIVDGALYLNYNARIQKKWEKQQKKYIAAADEKWPKLRKSK